MVEISQTMYVLFIVGSIIIYVLILLIVIYVIITLTRYLCKNDTELIKLTYARDNKLDVINVYPLFTEISKNICPIE